MTPTRIVLGHEPAFSLGPLTVYPAKRQVVGAEEQYTVEPRVMQVLVVLAKAGGEVVSLTSWSIDVGED